MLRAKRAQSRLRGVWVWSVLCGLLVAPGPGPVRAEGPVVGTASSLVNIFPDDPPAAGELATRLELSAARRERQSAQIVIIAGREPVAVDRVTVTGLRQGNAARLSARDNVEFRLVGFVDIEENSWRGIPRTGLWPDPLLDLRPFVCPAGQARSIWVTVQVPDNAPAGRYEGTVALLSGDRTLASIPLSLRVFDFSLPRIPLLHTSYWTQLGTRYDLAQEPHVFERMVRLFGQYRTSTNLWNSANAPVWYREPGGEITCDASRIQQALEMADEYGLRTFEIGSGCWATSSFEHGRVVDRLTGAPLPAEERGAIPTTVVAQAYLSRMADWLQSKQWLDRAYLQIYDELSDPAQFPWIAQFYGTYRELEPRIRLLGLIGIHPSLQGAFDIWSPHLAFYDRVTYDMVRRGVSLYGHKNFEAQVTASSTGGWGTGAFYRYQPVDAYDGCEYTKWVPEQVPTADQPQWLRFDFATPAQVDGLRLVPFVWPSGPARTFTWQLEVSTDGETFTPLAVTPRQVPGCESGTCYGFTPGTYQAVRLVWTELDSDFVPTDLQPLPPPATSSAGVRQVEFLREGLPLESTWPRAGTRGAELWEYQVGADYPAVTIDADPTEIRATGWQCWQRRLVGYLNYGGGIWDHGDSRRPETQDPLIWPVAGGNGSPWITYPGREQVLPSIRFARFRDGLQDYDYLTMLEEADPDHYLVARLRADRSCVRQPARRGDLAPWIARNRLLVARALERRSR